MSFFFFSRAVIPPQRIRKVSCGHVCMSYEQSMLERISILVMTLYELGDS